MYKTGIKILVSAFLTAAVLLLAAGMLPLKRTETFIFHSEAAPEFRLQEIRHLTENDVFNAGDTDDLRELPGIGETISSMVIAERNANGPFYYPEDILSVKGIGVKTLEKMRPFLTESED